MVFIENQGIFINSPRGWQNSARGGKIAPAYSTYVLRLQPLEISQFFQCREHLHMSQSER